VSGRLAGKVAIVTGAGQGIGEATANAYGAEDACVVVAEINENTGALVADRISRSGRQARFIHTDVTSVESLSNTVRETLKEFGRIDILVANAGINVFSDPLELSDEDWRRCFKVDLDGVWYSIRAVLPQMLLQGSGSIIAMASCHSFFIIPGCFPYPVAKHGVIGLVRALAIQYASKGIRVNAIAPGYVETELARQYWTGFDDPEAERKRVENLHPPRRVGTPKEVAMTAVFLGSDEAPFINAATITLDGGRSVLYHEQFAE
jgi:NAD(P)-dependent dehydrogenase (short-subunit alcohol dehydrogenase family)